MLSKPKKNDQYHEIVKHLKEISESTDQLSMMLLALMVGAVELSLGLLRLFVESLSKASSQHLRTRLICTSDLLHRIICAHWQLIVRTRWRHLF